MPGKVWDEFAYPFPSFNSATFEVWERLTNPTFYWACEYSPKLGFKLNRISKRGPRVPLSLAEIR